MAIKIRNVGHVVLKVRDIERSARFYRDVLGLKEVARGNFGRPMAFYTKLRLTDHRVSQSIYLDDPDGNGVELYVDGDPAIWREDPSRVASVGPLTL